MVDPRVVADLARSLDPRRTRRGDSIESSPPRPPPAHGATGRGVKRAGPHPGGTTGLEGAHLASRWSWSWSRCGRCRGPRSSALPSHSPGARPARPAGRAPGTSSGQSGEQPPGPGHHGPVRSRSAWNRPSRAPVSLNRRATSRPSTGLFLSSVALNRRQSFHQGLHRPLNTPPDHGLAQDHCRAQRGRRAGGRASEPRTGRPPDARRGHLRPPATAPGAHHRAGPGRRQAPRPARTRLHGPGSQPQVRRRHHPPAPGRRREPAPGHRHRLLQSAPGRPGAARPHAHVPGHRGAPAGRGHSQGA